MTKCYTQNNIPFTLHGTIIIAAIGSDGIVIATDSRMVLKDSKGTLIAYIDGVKKLYQLKKFVFALAGNPMINGNHFFNTLKHLDTTNVFYNSPREFIDLFLNYYREISSQALQQALQNSIYVSGYYNGFKVNNEFQTENIRADSFYMSNYRSYIDSNKLWNFKPNLTTKELIPMVEKVINKIIKLNEIKDIGGPITILAIDKNNNVTSVKDTNKYTLLTDCDIVELYYTNKNKIHLFKKEYKDEFDSMMLKMAERCRGK